MHVDYETFEKLTLGDGDIPEEAYSKMAPMADAIIDHWTLGRVGMAVKDGEDLPDIVITLYVKVIESIPDLMDGTKVGKGGLVSSFSNGIDEYTFDVSETIQQQMTNRFGWMLDLLPVEWISACVPFEGGNKYAS